MFGEAGLDVIASLVLALKDSNAEVRAMAALALGRIGPPAEKAILALKQALSDPDAAVKQEAMRALNHIRLGSQDEDRLPVVTGG
jgi:HEAT repeat protein